MLTALTRGLSSRINECELTFIERQPIHLERAIRQHRNYQQLLKGLGVQVTEIPADEACPDCCFLEDTTLVLDELAVVTCPGSEARRREVDGVLPFVQARRNKVERIELPATVEGGDVLRMGRELFVGITQRTNREGIEALRRAVSPYGYVVHAVDVPGALHLKSVCTALDERTILAETSRLDVVPFSGFEIIEVPPEEWMAANILRVNRTICMHSDFTKTQRLLQEREYEVRTVDISEFLKAEAGLTCLSIIFADSGSFKIHA